jgi:enoyl-CoA hydratase/carnithine racemase
MKKTEVIFEVLPGADRAVGKIVLNRPESLNALTMEMCQAIHRQLLAWDQSPAIKAVMIVGSGDRAFCAGGDIRAIYEWCLSGRQAQALDFFRQEYAMNRVIFDFRKPYIAFLEGIVMGGGVGLSLHGSHTVIGPQLRWAMPEARIGFFPDVGVGYRLARIPEHVGDYLALTGESITATDLFRLGLGTALIPPSHWSALEERLLKTRFVGSGFETVSHILEEFHQDFTQSDTLLSQHAFQIKEYFSRSTVAQIFAELQRSSDPWCQATAKLMASLSPLSLAVTACHLGHCRYLNFEKVMAENLILCEHFLHAPDFLEGIRAAVIDKDRRPHWRPATLAEASSSLVDHYFK